MRILLLFVWLLVAITAFTVPWLVAIVSGLPPQGGENAGLAAVVVLGVCVLVLLLVRISTVHESAARYEAAPERVFAVLADPRNFVSWSPPLAAVEVEGEPGTTGSRYVGRAHGGRVQQGVVVAAESPSTLVVRLRAGRGRRAVVTQVHRSFVATPDGTEVRTRRIIRASLIAQLFLRLQLPAIENQQRWVEDRIRDHLARTALAAAAL